MENHFPATLLIVEDDLDIADMLNAYFSVQGYRILTVNWGEDALNVCQTEQPDIVILDIRLPDLDGFEVARRLKINRRTESIPIIFLTEKRQREDRLRGLALAVEDYITKPFDFQELRLKVRNVLLRHKRSSLINPVTGLPERQLFTENIDNLLKTGPFGIVLVNLYNVDYYREIYGFMAADDILRSVSEQLKESSALIGSPNEPLAHWERLNFVLTLPENQMEPFVNLVQERLEKNFEQSYQPAGRLNTGFDSQIGFKIHSWVVNPEKESLQKVINDIDHLTN